MRLESRASWRIPQRNELGDSQPQVKSGLQTPPTGVMRQITPS